MDYDCYPQGKTGSCLTYFCIFFILYNIGFFIVLYPGGALILEENKICSRMPLTIEPSTQSLFG